MSNDKVQSTSRIKIYWCVWLSILAIALTLRFTVFVNFARELRPQLGVIYIYGTWLPIMILVLVENCRLWRYMMAHHRRKWEQISVRGSFSTLPWLYSADDLGDPAVAALKEKYRHLIYFVLTVLFSSAIVVPILRM